MDTGGAESREVRLREVGELLVVAGPSAVGKTRFLERLRGGMEPEAARELRLGAAAAWTQAQASKLHRLDLVRIERLLVHHDVLRSHAAEEPNEAREQAERLFRMAASVTVATLHCAPEQLLARLRARHEVETIPRRRDRDERLLALYRRRGALRAIYARWSEFAARGGRRVLWVDVASEPARVEGPESLGRVLARFDVRSDG